MRSFVLVLIVSLSSLVSSLVSSLAHAGKARLMALQGINVFPQSPAASLIPNSFLGVFPGAPVSLPQSGSRR